MQLASLNAVFCTSIVELCRRLDQFIDYFIVVPILAIHFIDFRCTLFTLENGSIELVDLFGTCAKNVIALLVNPYIKDFLEEMRGNFSDVLLIGFDALIQIGFHTVPNHYQVNIKHFQFTEIPVLDFLFQFQTFFLLIEPERLLQTPSVVVGDSVVDPIDVGQCEILVENSWVGLKQGLLLIQNVAEEDRLELVKVEHLADLEQKWVWVSLYC